MSPAGIAAVSARTSDAPSSSSDAGSRSTMRSSTGRPSLKLKPQSPRTKAASQLTYCTHSGRSSPSARRRRSRSSGPHAGIRKVDLDGAAGHELQQAEGDARHQQQERHGLDAAAPGQSRQRPYSSVHACTFQNGPVLVGLPVKPLRRAGTASSLVTP